MRQRPLVSIVPLLLLALVAAQVVVVVHAADLEAHEHEEFCDTCAQSASVTNAGAGTTAPITFCTSFVLTDARPLTHAAEAPFSGFSPRAPPA